ncbi:MAG: hypothetical protein Q4B03_08420, partial [Lachnospiraceae bacterium]|nr:hypothetical protein [Lachnospiraceae bacterium]
VILCILTLADLFIAIHFLFCYQIGLPASVAQNNSLDLSLGSSDWLGFLGSYLGFSGSLVMAYLVYRQSKLINDLTISDYSLSISIGSCYCVKDTEFGSHFDRDNLLQYVPDDKETFYYTYHCDHEKDINSEYESFSVLLFFEIINNSKSTISGLSFSSIEIADINGNHSYCYTNKGQEWDPADRKASIKSGAIVRRCFLLEDVPCKIDISWLRIRFSCDGNKFPVIELLISKRKGESIIFLDISS